MYNVPIIVCGSVAERGLDEKRGATRATRDVVFLMYPDKSLRKYRLDLPLLAEPTGGLSSTLGCALIPSKGLS